MVGYELGHNIIPERNQGRLRSFKLKNNKSRNNPQLYFLPLAFDLKF